MPKLAKILTDLLSGLSAQPETTNTQSIDGLLKSDDFWRMFWSQFWLRLIKSVWAVVAGTITALAILSTLVFNALRLWDRLFGAPPGGISN